MFVRAHQKVKSSRFPDSEADRALASDPAFREVCDARRDELVSAFDAHVIAQALAARSSMVSA